MTVKLAKFFSSSAAGAVAPSPLPLPLPQPTGAIAHQQLPYYSAAATHLYRQPQSHSQPPPPLYNAYMDDGGGEDDDNMSLYSTTASSIMTARDHPYNSSQRPLLAERKPPQLLLLNKKKHFNVLATAATTNQMQPQQQQRKPQQQQEQQRMPNLSPYAQQQKRDSAKGLHGFNDFDILSQQYNQHLQSPHIGYPYGSPPSPTANSSDFVFDTLTQAGSQAAAPLTSVPRYANISQHISGDYATVVDPATPMFCSDINAVDYYASATVEGHAGKPSRFEDDFCCRRNENFGKPAPTASLPPLPSAAHTVHESVSSASEHGGPFIFGVPLEQQSGLTSRTLPGDRSFHESTEDNDTVINGGMAATAQQYRPSLCSTTHCVQAILQQSTSDTSNSSRDCSGGNNNSSSKGGAKKFLLRKCKAKKNKKEKLAKTDASSSKATIKCVVVGDGAVGKTNLIRSYLENRFNTEHVPTASDIYNADVMVNDSPVHLTLCDTAGQDTLDPLRELCYPDSNVFLLCFNVAKPETFHSIKTKWAPKFCKTKAALILVGTQADLRTDANVLNKLQTNGEKAISYADAWDLATTIGAKYIETSSATQDKVKEVFDTAIWEGLVPTTLPPTPPPLWKRLFCLA